jgi:SGNH hydrolase-like domain, acetyltransferase AlgX
VLGLSGLMLFGAIYLVSSRLFSTKKKPSIEIEFQCNQVENIQIFYNIGSNYNPNDQVSVNCQASSEFQVAKLMLPNDTILKSLRLDFGALPSNYRIKRISIVNGYGQKNFYASEIFKYFQAANDIDKFEVVDQELQVSTNGEDGYIISNFDINPEFIRLGQKKSNKTIPIIISFIICIGLWIIFGKKITNAQIKPSRIVLLIGFITLISTPFYLLLLGLNVDKDNSEFRTKAESPKWNIFEWESYLKKYNTYFEDQFGLRSQYIKLYANYKTKLWKSSPVPEKVLIGKSGWLYTVEDSLMEEFRGIKKFKAAQLEEIYQNLQYRKERLLKMGIQYYILIAPNKQTIYPEYIQKKYTIVDKNTRWKQTKQYLLSKGINYIIDPTEALVKETKNSQPYYKTDLHWSNMGAFIASQLLLEQIHKDIPTMHSHLASDYNITPIAFTKGDLARMINAYNIPDKDYKFSSPALDKLQYFPGPAYPSYVSSQPTILTISGDTTKPKTLMFRDSFGNGMIQFISQESSTAIYVWTHVFDWAIIEQEKPTIVIHEISEKLIHKFLEE